ncbi:NAD(P)-binding domain-containing protein [Rhodococcus koreensis]|uniref:NAD(P)-dependent oxidoreductase n=1 Tax=Rhodococcus koreensis TaxID=99653 RepID=UPI00366AD2DF
MKVAIIGCGEVGRAYALAGAAAGYELVLVDPRPSAATTAVADQTRAALHLSPDEAVGDVDRVWICVSGDLVKAITTSLIGKLPGHAVVVDLTTASPDDKRECSATLAAHGIEYVDAVIMGSVTLTGSRTALLAAGQKAGEVLAEFAEFGAPVQTMAGGRAGDAAAIKLLRTILTKGLESLVVECFMAAEQQGLRSNLYDVLTDVDTIGFVPFLEMLITSHVQHAERRMHEVERARAQLAEMGCPSVVLAGTEARFALTSAALKDKGPGQLAAGDVASTIAWLSNSARASETV